MKRVALAAVMLTTSACTEERVLAQVRLSVREAIKLDGALSEPGAFVDVKYDGGDGIGASSFGSKTGASLADISLPISIAGTTTDFTLVTRGGDRPDGYGRSAVVELAGGADDDGDAAPVTLPIVLGEGDAVSPLLQAPPGHVDDGACLGPDNSIVTVGGLGADQAGYRWDPVAMQLLDLPGEIGPRGRASCAVVDDGTVFVFGGCDPGGAAAARPLVRIDAASREAVDVDVELPATTCGGVIRRAGSTLWLVAGSAVVRLDARDGTSIGSTPLQPARAFPDVATTHDGGLVISGGVDGSGTAVGGSVVLDEDGTAHTLTATFHLAQGGQDALALGNGGLKRVHADGSLEERADVILDGVEVRTFAALSTGSLLVLGDDAQGSAVFYVAQDVVTRMAGVRDGRTSIFAQPGDVAILAGGSSGLDVAIPKTP